MAPGLLAVFDSQQPFGGILEQARGFAQVDPSTGQVPLDLFKEQLFSIRGDVGQQLHVAARTILMDARVFLEIARPRLSTLGLFRDPHCRETNV